MGLFTRPFQVNGQPTVFLTLSGPSKASGTIGEPRLSVQERSVAENGFGGELQGVGVLFLDREY